MKTKYLLLSFTVLAIMFLVSGFRSPNRLMRALKCSADPVSVTGDSFNLAKYKGKVVILNFWASWSKTSRAENKNIVRVYQKYKANPKVVFVSVSLDTDDQSWKAAIDEDELAWPNHICDYKKYQSPIALKYSVNTVPKIFLVDTKGNITTSSSKMIDLENSIDGLLK